MENEECCTCEANGLCKDRVDPLINRFMYHPPKGDQVERYKFLRSMGLEMAQVIEACCPESRERSIAMTKLDEVIMFSNAAIARNENHV